MTELNEKPPANTKRIYRWSNLPTKTKPADYIIENTDGEYRTITVARHQRQVLEGLMQSPILAASYCRVSDQVLPLRRDHGIEIECKMYQNDPETGRERFGVYFLKSTIRRLHPSVEAA